MIMWMAFAHIVVFRAIESTGVHLTAVQDVELSRLADVEFPIYFIFFFFKTAKDLTTPPLNLSESWD